MTLAGRSLTLSDFLQLPEIEAAPAWELIDGVPHQKPVPAFYHSRLQKRLVAAIDQASSAYKAFPELRCLLGQNSVVPDITVIHHSRIPMTNSAIEGAPDWMIEILSPDQSATKVIAKIQACLRAGSQLGWLLDAEERIAMAFWRDRPLALLTGTDTMPVLPEINLILTAAQIFSWLPQKPVKSDD
ncbi:Uma2 family endonuclease [Sphaerothrix gracilis]|uniref:Uma2 family endonuclease n=1 Tax=Sphaerothrix gracilis TaxID=3151835 RepID=UPI0031FBFEDA